MPVAIVTGGNRGLGLSQSRRFIEEGFCVVVVARSAGDIAELDGEVSLVEADIGADREAAWLADIHGRHGRVDVLVNNAGMHLKKPVWEVAPDELDRVLGLNTKAVFAACGRYVELQRETGGAIVNVASMGAMMALPSAAAYVTAKTAVVGLTRSVAVDAAPFGIRCNAVSPGFIDTAMTRAVLEKDPARRERIERRIPGHAFGTPQDVADAVFFLASDRARHINGVNLPVDGGYMIGF